MRSTGAAAPTRSNRKERLQVAPHGNMVDLRTPCPAVMRPRAR
jgi:hypothetical protein